MFKKIFGRDKSEAPARSLDHPRKLKQGDFIKIGFDSSMLNYKKKIIMLKPGITGIGSLVFRNEEKYLHSDVNDSNDFYKDEIVPFKASLECWYHDNSSIFVEVVFLKISYLYFLFEDDLCFM